jgi:hypothetical protein
MKALLLHVGVDHTTDTHMTMGISAPIFHDGTFEFIPILELWEENTYFLRRGDKSFVVSDSEEQEMEPYTSESRTYAKIPSSNSIHGKFLADFIPNEYSDAIVHFDPDLTSLTYGDRIDTPKGKQIEKLTPNDYIFFVSSLAPYIKEAYFHKDKDLICAYQKRNMAKYVIGYFKVKRVLAGGKVSGDSNIHLFNPSGPYTLENTINNTVDDDTLARIKHNAHSKRDSDDYLIVIGDVVDSHTLKRAVKLTENGSPFRPSKIGKEIYGDVCFPRGFKWIKDEKIETLLKYCNASI